MGKFYTASISIADQQERATSISNFFNNIAGLTSNVIQKSYNTKLFYCADITIDNTDFELIYGTSDDSGSYNAYCELQYGTMENPYIETTATGNWQTNDFVMSAYVDNDFVALFIHRAGNNSNHGPLGVEATYAAVNNNKNLIGYKAVVDTNTSIDNIFYDISGLVFYDVSDAGKVPYTYTNMFPYVATAGTIDFTNEAFFVNGANIKSFISETLKECSTVTLCSTQSLPVGNCIALGAHCLAPLDD